MTGDILKTKDKTVSEIKIIVLGMREHQSGMIGLDFGNYENFLIKILLYLL